MSEPTSDYLNADDGDEGDVVDFWTKKQRQLVTASVDYNLSTLLNLVQNGEIDLTPKYQRRARWDSRKQSKLIESFLMNVPIPPVFLNEDEIGSYSVIDGKQRLTAITTFLSGSLRLAGLQVFADINGMNMFEMPRQLQQVLRTRPTIRGTIILSQSDPDIKNEVFHRLNTGGTPLNAQEVRNNAYSGQLNDLIMELADGKRFHSVLGIKNKERSAIYREMRDAELVLRFFTFKDRWNEFSGGMKRNMDTYMRRNRSPSEAEITDLRSSFENALSKVTMVFGSKAFQRYQPERDSYRQQVVASLYDAQMFGLLSFSSDDLRINAEPIADAFRDLFSDGEFRKSIDAATNTPSLFRERITKTESLVREVIG